MAVLSESKTKFLLWLHKYYVCSKLKLNNAFLQFVAHVYLNPYPANVENMVSS